MVTKNYYIKMQHLICHNLRVKFDLYFSTYVLQHDTKKYRKSHATNITFSMNHLSDLFNFTLFILVRIQ